MKNLKEKWELKETKKIYSDPWIQVRLDDVVRADGTRSTYSVVEIKGGIGVVVLTPENKIYLVGQYRYTVDMYTWEIPKGAFSNFDHTDSPLETARRELSEETGITAVDWKEITTVHTLLGSTNDIVHLFLATGLSEGIPHPDDTEDIKTKLVTFEEFYRMVKSQEITDATSIAAVTLAEKMLQNTEYGF